MSRQGDVKGIHPTLSSGAKRVASCHSKLEGFSAVKMCREENPVRPAIRERWLTSGSTIKCLRSCNILPGRKDISVGGAGRSFAVLVPGSSRHGSLSEQGRLRNPSSFKDGERKACRPWRGAPKISKGYATVSSMRGKIPHPLAGHREATESQACFSGPEIV